MLTFIILGCIIAGCIMSIPVIKTLRRIML